jgi:hypothetical protein
MASGETAGVFSGRGAVCQRHDFAALAEDHVEDGEVKNPVSPRIRISYCEDDFLTKGDSL